MVETWLVHSERLALGIHLSSEGGALRPAVAPPPSSAWLSRATDRATADGLLAAAGDRPGEDSLTAARNAPLLRVLDATRLLRGGGVRARPAAGCSCDAAAGAAGVLPAPMSAAGSRRTTGGGAAGTGGTAYCVGYIRSL